MFLSTFLGQMSDLCNGVFPDSGDALKERLRNTALIGHKAVQYKEKNAKALHDLEELVEKMDDDGIEDLIQRVTLIREKKQLLIHLLYQTQEEIDYITKRGEQYQDPPLSNVCEEENMLSVVLEKTGRERERIESYQSHHYLHPGKQDD